MMLTYTCSLQANFKWTWKASNDYLSALSYAATCPWPSTNPTLQETLNWGAASHPSIEVFHATLCGLYTRAFHHIGCDTTTSYKGKCVSDWRVVPDGHQLSLECLYQKPPYDLYMIASAWLLLFADKLMSSIHMEGCWGSFTLDGRHVFVCKH